MEGLRGHFRPEFLNRLDEIIMFRPLTRDNIGGIIELLIADINKRIDLWVEIGLQTSNDETAKLINRGYDYATFVNSVNKLRKHNINVTVHIINGLPNETKETMLNTVKEVNKLDIQGIKIHMLHVIKNTDLEKMYNEEKFSLLTRDEYINLVCDQLEILKSNIVVHRLTGDPMKEELVAPTWTIKKIDVLNGIDKELVRRNSYQGKYYKNS